MFKRLRLQLMLLYPLVGLALVVLFGGGAYLLVRYYLLVEYYPDIELEARMAESFENLEIAVPDELRDAEITWQRHRTDDMAFVEVEESPMSILFLDEDGQVLRSGGEVKAVAVAEGVEGAQRRGRYLHTALLPDGKLTRILTYRLPPDFAGDAAYLQIGRGLSSEDLTITRLYITVIALGVLVAVLIALFSWWLAGRSLLSTQRAWERQQQFVANASHELRAPITLIRANAEVARRSGTREPRRLELLEDIVQECDHVSRLVEDLLLLSRLDARKLALSKDPVQVSGLIDEVHEQFRSLADRQGVSLVLDARDEMVQGDRTRLRQVLVILVDNALKFTPTGGTVRLGSIRKSKHIEIFVKDSGIGIPQDHLPRVFDRFYLAEGSRGSGLGLPIAKGLVEAQGGSIRIESRSGEGTKVTVRLLAG